MKFFIDSANLKEIKQAKILGLLDGITTNPSLISKENVVNKKQLYNHYISICNLLDNLNIDISIEIISTNYDNMIEEAIKISNLHKKIVVKVPIIKDGIRVIKYLSNKGIKTNCTLIFSPLQSILAAKSGATYVSPFLGRLNDIAYNGISVIKEIKQIYDNYNFTTKILVASIRNPIHILECAKLGVYAITSPLNILLKSFYHPMTDIGLNNFLEDYNEKIKF
ncbi:fructose-6-phosphate aldolase [Blattabacterium cuenoti]|uniref:fructose-6-phosphate aldolase n=1 Tax=Blattabacterium cuenoti TaxID=1653831 RepID=UPI00163B9C67|nr:fructose-6-phosphate aldolase [Blattabacterium cuenoti]